MERLIAEGPHFHVGIDDRGIVWSGTTRTADAVDARLFAAALTAAADKVERERHAREDTAREAPVDHGAVERVGPRSPDYRIWFGSSDASEHTGLSQKSIVRALQTGELKGQQRTFGGRWRIHRDDLDAWMRSAR